MRDQPTPPPDGSYFPILEINELAALIWSIAVHTTIPSMYNDDVDDVTMIIDMLITSSYTVTVYSATVPGSTGTVQYPSAPLRLSASVGSVQGQLPRNVDSTVWTDFRSQSEHIIDVCVKPTKL